jgi:hypothetical protein
MRDDLVQVEFGKPNSQEILEANNAR